MQKNAEFLVFLQWLPQAVLKVFQREKCLRGLQSSLAISLPGEVHLQPISEIQNQLSMSELKK